MIVKHDFIYTPTGQGKNRPLHIYLPNDYHDTDEYYPVMYFFDGHNLYFDEDTTYGKSWGLRTFMEQWDKQMIIVGIECGREGEERLSEYLPYMADEGSSFSRFEVMGDKTLQWIIEEIKPFIDKTYRTIPFRECTAIAGSSMGGLMALYGVVHYNQWISKAACISSAIGFCMPEVRKGLAENEMNPDTRVYLSWGTMEAHGLDDVWNEDRTSDTYKWNSEVAEHIWASDATAKLCSQVGGHHCEADWEKLIPDFMSFLWRE